MLGFFTSMDIGASGLEAQRIRMNVIANNMANINTTRDRFGRPRPYQRRMVVFTSGAPELTGSKDLGVRVKAIIKDNSDFRKVYDPGHPDANKDGYVLYPNVRLPIEMVDMIEAVRAYEANIRSMEAAKSMIRSSLELLR